MRAGAGRIPRPSEPAVRSADRFFRVIASIYELHAELAEITLDAAARRRLLQQLRSLRHSLREAVGGAVYAELDRLDPVRAVRGREPTQDELRVACSELLGWLVALLPEAERAAAHRSRGPAAGPRSPSRSP